MSSDFAPRGQNGPPGMPDFGAELPQFPVALTPPDLARWEAGNTGIPGFTSYVADEPGPHVLIMALMHGNEIAGAIALHELLQSGIRPARGQLTLGFGNLAAFQRFDAQNPIASRFIDEDMNRVWDSYLLEGPRQSVELTRAREIRPLIDTVDIALDLHSMLWPSDPLLLCGPTTRGQSLARAIGTPGLVVADQGHAGGRRLIDYDRFTDPQSRSAGVLVEAGQHWQPETVGQMSMSITSLLRHTGMQSPHQPIPRTPRFAEVTHVVTATTQRFGFIRPFRGGDVIERRDTIIAYDGDAEIRTPHDDCLLVMPSHKTSRGHTAVRLARFV